MSNNTYKCVNSELKIHMQNFFETLHIVAHIIDENKD